MRPDHPVIEIKIELGRSQLVSSGLTTFCRSHATIRDLGEENELPSVENQRRAPYVLYLVTMVHMI